ncbi:membralin [Drosophila serrata]|uniref:membralin n=1 Tax=Drosophila serrata TaxID=7274 RepID=UPI000A1D0F60|nr:membralin [Drosophila serrata]
MAAVLPENAAEIAVANAINNINGNNANGNGRNRVLAGGGGVGGGGGLGGGGQNNMMNMRDRLFHAIYFRAAAAYAELVPRKVQLTIEFLLLAKALLFFFTLIYVHNAFIKNPCTCLQEVQNWPREGVIRVEIIPHLAEKRAIWQGIKRDQHIVRSLKDSYYYGIGPQTHENHKQLKRYESILGRLGLPVRPTFAYSNESLYYYFDAINILDTYDHPNAIQLKNEEDDEEQYIVEYSLEYGHLRLSAATRKRLQIPVLTVQLDPNTNKCFGDGLTRYLLKRLLGYDDLLMASVRAIAEKEENKGYLRNVITGEHYRFVSMWWAAWSSYPVAFCVMLLFTFSVSMLLRYSHHQIFVFIVDLLQMLEYNVSARFPIAPLLTVILALVGMEAIMSEFFNDTTTAFYIILIVWIADQYDAICCHTSITKRHWLRFFYLYHFAFYAYHYRFSGQYRTLALLSSYLFTQHSIVFFFHRYELPAIMAQHQVFIITRNQGAAAAAAAAAAARGGVAPGPGGAAAQGDPGAEAGAPVVGQQAAMQRARHIVTRLFVQLAAQRRQQRLQQQQQQQQQQPEPQRAPGPTYAVGVALANLRRLPVVGQWLQGREQFATVRRVFLGHGGNGRLMQVHLQRINVADMQDIQGLRNQITAAIAAAGTRGVPPGAGQRAEGTSDEPSVATGDATTAAAGAAAGSSPVAGIAAAGAADVETNQGRKQPTTGGAAPGINDAAAGEAARGAEAAQDKPGRELEMETEMELELKVEPKKELQPPDGESEAGVSKTLENLNSVAADIINMSDKTTGAPAGAVAPHQTLIHTHADVHVHHGQPKARQLENNLPELLKASSGEKQSCPLPQPAHSIIMNDQQQQQRQQKNKQDEAEDEDENATAATTSAAAMSKQSSKPGAAEVGAIATATAGPMMDDRQTVDFIEGDSPTSAVNCQLNVGTNHKAQEQGQQQQEQQLMKTSQHTSSQVTTAAAAAATATAAATLAPAAAAAAKTATE